MTKPFRIVRYYEDETRSDRYYDDFMSALLKYEHVVSLAETKQSAPRYMVAVLFQQAFGDDWHSWQEPYAWTRLSGHVLKNEDVITSGRN